VTGTVANPVRAKLLRGETAWGVMAFEFFTPGLPYVLASAGAEFVILDTEHSGVGIDTIKMQIACAHGAGIVPLVRVPGHAYHLVAPVLDAGAMGIMLPMTETRAEAEALVQWCRYRPEGKRGLAFGIGHDRWRPGEPAASMAAANDSVLTIALIETATGVANAREILSVPGIDLGWLGHFDLSDSMGIPGKFDDPRFIAAEAQLLDAAKAAGKPVGWLAGDAAAARAALNKGFRALCLSTDVALLRDGLSAMLRQAKA
jgi:2-keto-3-deoxy-L-rhamnonate aldolase RhmA